MSTPRIPWGAAGIIAGLAGLAVSHGATKMLPTEGRSTPLVAVAELVIDKTPGPIAHKAIELLGQRDKPVLILIVFLVMLAFMLMAGRLAEKSWWAPILVYLFMGGFALYAVLSRYDAKTEDFLPVAAGTVTWIIALSFLTDPMRRAAASPDPEAVGATRRGFLIRTGVTVVAAGTIGVVGDVYGRGRRKVEEARRLLKLAITNPNPPQKVRAGVDDIVPWKTPNKSFYRIDTTFVAPAIRPTEWSLRIHGMVERDLTFTFQELVDRELTEAWITLNCVSNEVGGGLIGNAWWSGVRIATLLEEAGIDPEADAVLQTSQDGWSCATPLSVLTDKRNAMIAIGMNGEPLPIDHGFPARMIVPGLYGYVSACKWLRDIEVSKFSNVQGYWTDKGWSEQGPVKIASRVDVPSNGADVDAGSLRIGGSAWKQHTGIGSVEYALDGGDWTEAELANVPSVDTWVQWSATVEVDEGDHKLLVRAIGRDGEVQTGVERDVAPDGATGWHEVEFNAS